MGIVSSAETLVCTGELTRSAQLARWHKLGADLGFDDLVSPEDGFKTCLRTGQRWSNRSSPGIYFWLAENGEAYVGQSVNPQSRLREHWRVHRDLVRASFRPCSRPDLDRVEAELIAKAGRHFALRNIKLAVSTCRPVPFDRLVSSTERDAFLGGAGLPDTKWRQFELLTRLHARRYERFVRAKGSREAIKVLQSFVAAVLPRPAATEVGFWSVTLFPDKQFVRLNAGQQEILTMDAGSGEVRLFSDERLSWLRSSEARYATPSYATSVQATDLQGWLEGDALLSCRRLAVRLMRHTTALNSGSHCPQALRLHS
jgi:hypothetical protein